MPRPVLIVGGGISGLSTAYYLSKAGIHSTIIERQPRLGGVIQTCQRDGCVLEAGPDSFLTAKPWALELIREIGLGGDVIASNDHLRVTYVRRKGRFEPLPDGLMLMAPTRILPLLRTGLLSWSTKLRMGLEWFRRPGPPLPERSVAEFIADHYGDEAVDYLCEPLLSGVYGGDPRQLSATAVLARFVEWEHQYGSLTRGALAAKRKAAGDSNSSAPLFQTLKAGLASLTEALEDKIRSHCDVEHAAVQALERNDEGFILRARGAWMESDHVVLACPAYEAATIVRSLDPELAQTLESIPYTSSMTVALGYAKEGFPHRLNGFGFLVPARERKRLVACTWVGTKFSHRVRDDRVVLRCFLGGARDRAALSESDETILSIVKAELKELMGIDVPPLFSSISRWPRSMAQYTVGHQSRVEAIETRIRRIPGLHVAGNAYYGIGIPDCVRMGRQAAERIARARP